MQLLLACTALLFSIAAGIALYFNSPLVLVFGFLGMIVCTVSCIPALESKNG